MPSPEDPSPSSATMPKAEIQNVARMLAEGQVAEALQRLEVLATAFPAYATSQVLLAKAYEASGQSEDALTTWHRAYFLVPGSPLVRRERMRLMRAQYRAAGVPPPVPDDSVEGEQLADPADSTETVANAPLSESQGTDVVEEELERDEDLAIDSAFGVTSTPEPEEAEAPSTDELRDDSVADDLPEVFVDNSDPVSDALGPAPVVEMWEDDLEAENRPTDVEEPIISAPDLNADMGEPVAGAPEDELAWWKRSVQPSDQHDPEDVDAGWKVVDEMETSDFESTIIEAEISAPAIEEPDSPPPQAGTTPSDTSLADDLDSLIRQLEDAPRIRPDPNFVDENEAFNLQESDDNGDDMVSETLARIYVAQGQYAEAADVYEKLAGLDPGQADAFNQTAVELRARVGGVN